MQRPPKKGTIAAKLDKHTEALFQIGVYINGTTISQELRNFAIAYVKQHDERIREAIINQSIEL